MLTRTRVFRMQSGESATQVARKLRVSDSLLCGIERGRLACPKWLRPQLAGYLGKEEHDLFDEHGFPIFAETE